MPRFTMLELIAAVALLAIHLAIARLAVMPPDHSILVLIGTALISPSLLTACLHWRLRLTSQTAMCVHYPLAVVWAFFFSLTVSLFWRSLPDDFYDRQSIGLESPFIFALQAAILMMLIAIATSIAYGCIACRFATGDQTTIESRSVAPVAAKSSQTSQAVVGSDGDS